MIVNVYLLLVVTALVLIAFAALYLRGSYHKSQAKDQKKKNYELMVKLGTIQEEKEKLEKISDIVKKHNDNIDNIDLEYSKTRHRIETMKRFEDLTGYFKKKYGDKNEK